MPTLDVNSEAVGLPAVGGVNDLPHVCRSDKLHSVCRWLAEETPFLESQSWLAAKSDKLKFVGL